MFMSPEAKTLHLTKSDLVKASEVLLRGGILAFPTETVFGVGVIYDNQQAYEKLCSLKGRSPDKPFSLMFPNVEMLLPFLKKDAHLFSFLKRVFPSPLTVLAPAISSLPSWVDHQTGIIGFRVPDDSYIQSLLKLVSKPCLVTSANRSGELALTSSREVFKTFPEGIDAIVEGESQSSLASTIIKVENNDLKLIRQGEIKFETLKKMWEETK